MTKSSSKQRNGVSEHSDNIIEEVDANYTEECFKLPPSTVTSIDPSDHVKWRKWLAEEYMAMPRAPPEGARARTTVHIQAQTIQIRYENGSQFGVRVYVPRTEDTDPRPVLIMYHGGGWIHGSPEVDEEISEFFASELRAVVVSVDYRLAPENQFPLPLDDCYEALQWTIDNAAAYNINRSKIGLWGCSAGGNLAAAVALRDAKEHDQSRIRHVNLVVPATCHPDLYPEVLKTARSSSQIHNSQTESIRVVWNKYAGAQYGHPYVSVLGTAPPPNHPPSHITVAARDLIRDEGIAYALQLRNAGIDTQLEIIPGVPHGITMPATTHAARQFFRNQARVLDCALNGA